MNPTHQEQAGSLDSMAPFDERSAWRNQDENADRPFVMGEQLLVAWGVTLLINLVPAFMPPTWSVVAFFAAPGGLPPLVLAVGCAIASTLGRTGLALTTRKLGLKLVTADMRTNLDALALFLREPRKHVLLGLIFMSPVSPFPSNQLFLAAGLTQVELRFIAPCFFVGRVVEYAVAAFAANRAATTLAEVFGQELTSAHAIVIELASLVSIVVMAKIPWARLLARWTPTRSQAPPG
jgi:uncharacterized membrane protein YdjX (TVP38/TMEM64 family)